MEILSDRINQLNESATIRMAQLSRELTAKGENIISLSLGEPDFNTPDHIRQAAIQAIQDGFTHYPPVQGFPTLRQAISEKFLRANGLHYAPDQIVVSTGAKQALINAILCLANPGDEIIAPAPYWVSYSAMAQIAHAKLVSIKSGVENDFKISSQQLEAAITDRTCLFLINSPCNPTGTVYSAAELEALAEVLAKYPHIHIISDEIYEHIVFGEKHCSIGSFQGVKDRVITVNGVSKGFAMTGWRIGYLGAPKKIADACIKMQGQYTSGACSIAQKAAEAAISGDLRPTETMRKAFEERRDLTHQLLSEIPGLRINNPQGAFYFFPDVTDYFGKSYSDFSINSDEDLCMYLLQQAKVSTVAGSAFGAENCIRVSYATSSENIREALHRIREALSQLK